MDIRCDGKKHGRLTEDGLLEFKCSSPHCTGGDRRAFVLHYIDPATWTIKGTSHKFRNPLKGMNNGDR